MAFKTTEWKYSKEEEHDDSVKPGPQYIQIAGARYDDSQDIYELQVRSLTNDAEFSLRYWLTSVKEGGTPMPNSKSRGTLISLGKALAGTHIGIPNPKDVIGGVVQVDVVMTKSTNGNSYPRVYQFYPVPKDIVEGFGAIDQYYLDEDEE